MCGHLAEVFFRKSESQDDSSQKVAHIDDVDFYLKDNSDSKVIHLFGVFYVYFSR